MAWLGLAWLCSPRPLPSYHQRGYFVANWGSLDKSEECVACESPNQLCDEEHQKVPKPAVSGVWIDPLTGDDVVCEPYTACVWHRSVEGVLSEICTEGYQVMLPCPTGDNGDPFSFPSEHRTAKLPTQPLLLSSSIVLCGRMAGLRLQRVCSGLLPRQRQAVPAVQELRLGALHPRIPGGNVLGSAAAEHRQVAGLHVGQHLRGDDAGGLLAPSSWFLGVENTPLTAELREQGEEGRV